MGKEINYTKEISVSYHLQSGLTVLFKNNQVSLSLKDISKFDFDRRSDLSIPESEIDDLIRILRDINKTKKHIAYSLVVENKEDERPIVLDKTKFQITQEPFNSSFSVAEWSKSWPQNGDVVTVTYMSEKTNNWHCRRSGDSHNYIIDKNCLKRID